MGGDLERGRGLSREEFEEVMRRATELAARDAESEESGIPESEVYRIAREVGLPEHHVRHALADVRSGNLSPVAGGLLERVFGPSVVRAARVVPMGPDEVADTLDEFLVAGQLLQRMRRSSRHLQYRPAVDWISQIARAASATSRRYYVASAKSVEVFLEPVDAGMTLVEFEVDPGTRNDSVLGAGLGGVGGGAGLAVGLGIAIATAAPVAVAVAGGVLAGGAFATGITAAVGTSHKKKVAEVKVEVEGILDRLEQGETLEPPPPSWKSWVQRQFHGARKLLDSSGDDVWGG